MNPDKGWLLAFDLSSPQGMLILDGPEVLLERGIEGGSRASRLFEAAEEMMSEAGIGPGALSVVGVGRGPGSFTGVRIAVTAAKFISYVLGVPLVAPDSLMVLAAGASAAGRAVFAALDARRGEVYYALFRFDNGYPVALIRPGVATPEQAAAVLSQSVSGSRFQVCGVGNGIGAYPDAWPGAVVEGGVQAQPAEGLARLCRYQSARREFVDPMLLLPLYLRLPDARERSSGAGREGPC